MIPRQLPQFLLCEPLHLTTSLYAIMHDEQSFLLTMRRHCGIGLGLDGIVEFPRASDCLKATEHVFSHKFK
jgi:hypothetical protein